MSGKLVPILSHHRFPLEPLRAWLRAVGLMGQGELAVHQFQGGQSNPTFLIEAAGRRLVLRKQPAGDLLESAHRIDREYRVMAALADTPAPVPRMRAYCDDPSLIGTPFYLMDYADGRVLDLPGLLELDPDDRFAIVTNLFDTLATLHQVDWNAIGLADFGRPQGFAARQLKRWSRQYELTRTEDVPAFGKLAAWLETHLPATAADGVVHGDFRLGNMIIHPSQPEVAAILDWELSTLGDPLCDLAYLCTMYHRPTESPGVAGLGGMDPAEVGLPKESEMLARYAQATGRKEIPNWRFYQGLAFFRIAAILQGVYHRALSGNAADSRAREVGGEARTIAELGWGLVQGPPSD